MKMIDGDAVVLDGSRGEGGGQMLRSSLALSMGTLCELFRPGVAKIWKLTWKRRGN